MCIGPPAGGRFEVGFWSGWGDVRERPREIRDHRGAGQSFREGTETAQRSVTAGARVREALRSALLLDVRLLPWAARVTKE